MTKDLIVGNIQFGPSWEKFFEVDRKINSGVAKNMYKALKGIVESSKLAPLQGNDQKAFDKCKDALVQYEISYNKN